MKKVVLCKTVLLLFAAFALICSASKASAFSLDDLSSAVTETTKAAKGAAKASELLTDAKGVYTGFSSMTEKAVNAQVNTMSLISPEKKSGLMSELIGFNSESGFSKLVKLTGFSEMLDGELEKLDLMSGLTNAVTESSGREKAVSILGDLKSSYSSGKDSVEKSKSLYASINEFLESPSSDGISGMAMTKLKDYSDQILPYIIENGPERLKSIKSLINTFSSVL